MAVVKSWPDVLPRLVNQTLPRVESLSPWFEIYQVADDTLALLEPFHMEEVISYLILGDRRAVLFDTGMGMADIRGEVERLTRLPVIVVNSHGHYDHIGGNHQFEDVWVFDDDFEVSLVEGGYDHDRCLDLFMGPGTYMNPPAGFDLDAYRIFPAKVTRRLQHLEVIDLGHRTLTVHHTPGHSPGSICLEDSRHGILFIGDFFVDGGNYLFVPETNLDHYRRSLTYLIERLDRVAHLCSAHNQARTEKEVLIRMDRALDAIASGAAKGDVKGNLIFYTFDSFRVILSHSPIG